MRTYLVALLLFVVAATGGGPAIASSRTFANCTALNRVYSSGIAKSQAAANAQVRAGNRRPTVSRPIYDKNYTRLDRDRDGTACERS